MKSKRHFLSRALALLLSAVLLAGNVVIPISASETDSVPGTEEIVYVTEEAALAETEDLVSEPEKETPDAAEVAPEPVLTEEIEAPEEETGEITTEEIEEGAAEEAALVEEEAALDGDVVTYDLWIGGKQVTDANKDDVLEDGTVAYDPTSATLKFEGATITPALVPGTDITAGIYIGASEGLVKNTTSGFTIAGQNPGSTLVIDLKNTTLPGDEAYGIYRAFPHWDNILFFSNIQLDITLDQLENPNGYQAQVSGISTERGDIEVGYSTINIHAQNDAHHSVVTGIGAEKIGIQDAEINIYAHALYSGAVGIYSKELMKIIDSSIGIEAELTGDSTTSVGGLATDGKIELEGADIQIDAHTDAANYCHGISGCLNLIDQAKSSNVRVSAIADWSGTNEPDPGVVYAIGNPLSDAIVNPANATLEAVSSHQAICGNIDFGSTTREALVNGEATKVGADLRDGQEPLDEYKYFCLFDPSLARNAVTYDPDNGEEFISRNIPVGFGAPRLPAPVKDGFDFVGWFEEGSDEEYDFSRELTGELKLIAHWTEAASEYYDVWVGGPNGVVQITNLNRDDVLEDGGSVKFDPDAGVLFLNDAQLTPGYAEDLDAYAGLYIGPGALDASADAEEILIFSDNVVKPGEYYPSSQNTITLQDKTIDAGKVYGVKSEVPVMLADPTELTITLENLEIEGGGFPELFGFYCDTLTADTSNLTINLRGENVIGLHASSLLAEAWWLTAKVYGNEGSAACVEVTQDATINNSKIDILANGVGPYCPTYGFYAGDAAVVFTGCEILIKCEGTGPETYGVYADSVRFGHDENDPEGFGCNVEITARSSDGTEGTGVFTTGTEGPFLSDRSFLEIEAAGGVISGNGTFTYEPAERAFDVSTDWMRTDYGTWDKETDLSEYVYLLSTGRTVVLLPGEGSGDPVTEWIDSTSYTLPQKPEGFAAPTTGGKTYRFASWATNREPATMEPGETLNLPDLETHVTAQWEEAPPEPCVITVYVETYDTDGTTLLPGVVGGKAEAEDADQVRTELVEGAVIEPAGDETTVRLLLLNDGYDLKEYYVEKNGVGSAYTEEEITLSNDAPMTLTVRFVKNNETETVRLNTQNADLGNAVYSALQGDAYISEVQKDGSDLILTIPKATAVGSLLRRLESVCEVVPAVQSEESLLRPHFLGTREIEDYLDAEELAEEYDRTDRIEPDMSIYFLQGTRIEPVEIEVGEAVCGDDVYYDPDADEYVGMPYVAVGGSDFAIANVSWLKADGSAIGSAVVGGETYKALITISPDFGYYLPENATILVNDEESETAQIVDGGIVLFVTARHDLEYQAETEPTEEEDGTCEHWLCSECGKRFAEEEGTTELSDEDLVLHYFGEWIYEEPTCQAPGSRTRFCEHHPEIFETEEIPVDPDAHVWDEGVIQTYPFLDEYGNVMEGERLFTCTLCGETTTGPVYGYKISFDPGEGEGEMAPVVLVEGESFVLPLAHGLSKEGYEFDSWLVEDETLLPGTEITPDHDLELIAQWAEGEYPEGTDPRDIAYIKAKNDNVVPKGVWGVLWNEADEEIVDDDLGVKLVYNGIAQKPKVHVYHGNVRLAEKKDYSLSYKNNIKASVDKDDVELYEPGKSPSVTINAKGNYKDKKMLNFHIHPETMGVENRRVFNDELFSFQLTGSKGVKITVPVSFVNGADKIKKLSAGTDYELKVTDIMNAEGDIVAEEDFAKYVTPDAKKQAFVTALQPGVYTIAVIGKDKGNFYEERTVEVHVDMQKIPMSKATVKILNKPAELAFTGSEVHPDIQITGSYKNPVTKKTEKFTEVLKGNIGAAEPADHEYEEGNYFVVDRLENATDIGTARLTVRAKEDSPYFDGEKTITFKIVKAGDLKKALITYPASVPYTGEAITFVQADPEASAVGPMEYRVQAVNNKVPGEILGEGIDFAVAYKNNVKAGKATITFTGLPFSGYAGTKVSKTFTIEKVDLSLRKAAEEGELGTYILVNEGEDVPYAKGGAKPKVEVSYTYEDHEGNAATLLLKEGTDYSVSYKNNKLQGVGTVTITGKGNFKNKQTAEFKIVGQTESEALRIDAKDILYKDKAGAWLSKAKVVDADGKTMKAGTDYDVVRYYLDEGCAAEDEITKAESLKNRLDPEDPIYGTVIYMQAKGMGNYAGTTITGEYHIMDYDISKAVVTVKNYDDQKKGYEYVTEPIEPKPEDLEVRFTRRDKTSDILVAGVDYEIVEGSYQKNNTKGTASFVIRGLAHQEVDAFGNRMEVYGNTKKVTFKIYQRSVENSWMKNMFRGLMSFFSGE